MKKLLALIASSFVFVGSPVYAQSAPNDILTYIIYDDNYNQFGQFISDPGAPAIWAWDPTITDGRFGGAIPGSGGFTYWTLGSGLSLSANHVLSATQGVKTFNYPSRSIGTCYQISSTQDASFSYKVDVSTALSLTSGAAGTATVTTYSNSACTTGAQVVSDGTAAQTGSLVVGLGVNQTVSVGLNGIVPAGKWVKITTANTTGSPTFALRAAQQEVLLP